MVTFAKMREATSTQTAFYDKRYREGYMESWDTGKIRKVRELLHMLALPAAGKALDFGSGNGVFTRVIKDTLPGWEVSGCEISPTALRNAAEKNPDCSFFGFEEAEKHHGSFDLIFSHHVIEHVDDLPGAFRQLDAFSSPSATHLHILPCGNAGSYEYDLTQMMRNGIEHDREDRFYFEEPGHLRRLREETFTRHLSAYGFKLAARLFSNQYWGAVNWITKSSPRFVKKLTDTRQAVDAAAAGRLAKARRLLLPLTWLQFPKLKYDAAKNRWHKGVKDHLQVSVLFIPALISSPLWHWLERKSDREWDEKKMEPNGSEMFLVYKRASQPE
jgi:SAM-dependent methyltransferase